MYKSSILLIIGFLYGNGQLAIAEPYVISEKKLNTHVAFLSADALAGRLTGSQGEKQAIQYAAHIFKQLGLQPAGEKNRFFQEFTFTAGVSLGNRNAFFITQHHREKVPLKLQQDWQPLAFSANQSFQVTELVFAGYGISTAAIGKLPAYDSYKGLNVKKKWVIVLREIPANINEAKRRQLRPYSSLRYKTFIAKKNGAKGIIFVKGVSTGGRDELPMLSFTFTSANAGIVALSIKTTIADDWLVSQTGLSLQALEDKLSTGALPHLPTLSHLKLTGQVDIQQKKQIAHNVLAKLTCSTIDAPILIVGAHIDHLGMGELNPIFLRNKKAKRIYHGADDNASGVASVLEVAAKLKQLQREGRLSCKRNILFALWSGEELGLLGSSYFIKQAKEQKKQIPPIAAYLNLDMVGHLDHYLMLQSVGSSLRWPALINEIKQKHALALRYQDDPYLPTDATAFYLQGIPALNFFTGAHEAYHTPQDQANTLNYAGMKVISNFLADFILKMASESNVISYHQVKKRDRQHAARFNVYLGTIPDYTEVIQHGVLLSGVAKSSPAERAGLRKGDRIVEVAKQKVNDIYDYTFVLNGLAAHVPVSIGILRDKQKLMLTIIPQARF